MLTADQVVLYQQDAPAPTETWEPVRHSDVILNLKDCLREKGVELTDEKFEFVDDLHPHTGEKIKGANMFYHAKITAPHLPVNADIDYRIGARNSHSQKVAIGAVMGASVIACSNMMFDGERKLTNIHRPGSMITFRKNFQNMINEGWLEEKIRRQNEIVNYLKNAYMSDHSYRYHVDRGIRDAKVYPNSAYSTLMDMWQGSGEELAHTGHNTKWRAHNIATEYFKKYQVGRTVKKVERLNSLLIPEAL